jgi:hypothetical protein
VRLTGQHLELGTSDRLGNGTPEEERLEMARSLGATSASQPQ